MASANINHKVLEWARKERALDRDSAADILSIAPEELAAYETGEQKPSITFLRRMASKYEINFVSLLLPEPPPPKVKPKDFRFLDGKAPGFAKSAMVAFQVVDESLEAFAELREDFEELIGHARLERGTEKDDPDDLAKRYRAVLGVSIEEQLGWKSDSLAFMRWRMAIESLGIFVYLIKFKPTSIRGFSMVRNDDLFAICVNSSETYNGARIFSLMHEFCHLLLRDPGISDENRTHHTERFCNQFAASLLMPADVVRREVELAKTIIWDDRDLSHVAKKFCVTRQSFTLRLEEVGLAHAGFYEEKLAEWRKAGPYIPPPGGGAMPWPERRLRRLGHRHASIVFSALDGGAISPIEAYRLLGTTTKHFAGIRAELENQWAAHGGRGA